jgi:hypothetical protein
MFINANNGDLEPQKNKNRLPTDINDYLQRLHCSHWEIFMLYLKANSFIDNLCEQDCTWTYTLSVVVCSMISIRFVVHNHRILTSFTWLDKRKHLHYGTQKSKIMKAGFFIHTAVPFIYTIAFLLPGSLFMAVYLVFQQLTCLWERMRRKKTN